MNKPAHEYVFKNEYDMRYAFKNIVAHFEEKGWSNEITKFSKENLAILIDKMRGCSQRYVAELVYREDDSRYGIQAFGKDAKLWAANIMGNYDEAVTSWAN